MPGSNKKVANSSDISERSVWFVNPCNNLNFHIEEVVSQDAGVRIHWILWNRCIWPVISKQKKREVCDSMSGKEQPEIRAK